MLAHLAPAAFHPARPLLPLLHIDSTLEFPETLIGRFGPYAPTPAPTR